MDNYGWRRSGFLRGLAGITLAAFLSRVRDMISAQKQSFPRQSAAPSAGTASPNYFIVSRGFDLFFFILSPLLAVVIGAGLKFLPGIQVSMGEYSKDL